MKTAPLERKKNEKIRKKRLIFFNKINNLDSNDANVYIIMEYNRNYFIYNSRFNKEWPPLEITLINDIILSYF